MEQGVFQEMKEILKSWSLPEEVIEGFESKYLTVILGSSLDLSVC